MNLLACVLALGLAAQEPEALDAGVVLDEVASPVPSAFEAFASTVDVRLFGGAWGHMGVDTRFDSPAGAPLAENVFDGRLRLSLGVDVKLSDRLRVVLEGRGRLMGATQRDFARAKGLFEPSLGEAYLDVYSDLVDLRIGQQRVALGSNAVFAPTDVLNPRDLRESLLLGEPEDAMLPVLALRARGEFAGLSWLLAYAPFFSPSRYALFGQDESLVQPQLFGAGASVSNNRVDPTIEDLIQDRLLESARPLPFAGDLALRLGFEGRVKVAASWVWANEKLPQVRVDPELADVLYAQSQGQSAPSAALVSVQNRFAAGETLYRGTYGRTHLFGLDGSALLGPVQVDVDVAFSPRQTFFDAALAPLSKASLQWVVGVSQAEDSPVLFSLTYWGLAAFGVLAHEQLLLVEPATARGADRVAFLHLLVGSVSYAFWDKRIDVGVRALFEPIQKSFAMAPRITYQGVDRLKVWLGAEFYEGPAFSPLGYFGRNDKVALGARVDLF